MPPRTTGSRRRLRLADDGHLLEHGEPDALVVGDRHGGEGSLKEIGEWMIEDHAYLVGVKSHLTSLLNSLLLKFARI